MTDDLIIENDDPSVVIDSESDNVDVDLINISTNVEDISDFAEINIINRSASADDRSSLPSMSYTTLSNKPSINEVTLIGDKSLEDIGINRITNQDILDIVRGRY